MNSTKNYSTDGGDTLVIGGKIVLEDGGKAEGFGGSSYTLPPATTNKIGGVKKAVQVDILEDTADLATVIQAYNNLLLALNQAGMMG